jgi:hypothetical protein
MLNSLALFYFFGLTVIKNGEPRSLFQINTRLNTGSRAESRSDSQAEILGICSNRGLANKCHKVTGSSHRNALHGRYNLLSICGLSCDYVFATQVMYLIILFDYMLLKY